MKVEGGIWEEEGDQWEGPGETESAERLAWPHFLFMLPA
jgi:hypothetical protein